MKNLQSVVLFICESYLASLLEGPCSVLVKVKDNKASFR